MCTLLKAVFFQFGGVFRFEAREFGAGAGILEDVGADLMAGLGVFLEDIPIMRLLFHLVFFNLDALRFEATLGFAFLGAEFEEVVERLVEGAGVGGLVAET